MRLFDRTTRGSRLTIKGAELVQIAERMESELLSGLDEVARAETVSGTIRIGAPDGFGSTFLAPRLGKIREAYPELNLQLVPVPHNFSLSEREADLAVIVGRPKKGRLRAKKLTDYSLSLYAASSYVEKYGAPTAMDDLKQHQLIGYVEDLIYSPELNFAGNFSAKWTSTIEISTAVGQFEAICAGVGIGICHDFMAAPNKTLIRLLPDQSIIRSYWLVWHENLRATRRVQKVADLISQFVQQDRSLFDHT